MEHRWSIIWCLFYLLPLILSVDEASFYGGSYISIPFKEAKSSTDIHFKFRTHLANALIFLVAGVTDYCIVKLDGGKLKININLGAGESEVLSSPKIKLNDFKWHDVSIVRKEANLSIFIDNFPTINKRLPGKFFELNVHYGLFVGGRGNVSEPFFGHSNKFRGCLSSVMYNGILVLDQARHRQLQATVHGVTWNCAAEFNAGVREAISFVEDGSFMSIPHVNFHNEVKIQLEFKTIVENGTLLYNSGPITKPDFFAIELWKGNVKCSLRNADKTLEVVNKAYISDGIWHKLFVRLSATSVELNVDSVEKLVKKSNHSIEMSDLLHIGAIEPTKRGRAVAKGLKTSEGWFKGCLKNLTVADKLKGLPDVHISQGLLPGCLWQFPCLQKPCTESSVCTQQGLDSFKCHCEEELCINPNYAHGYKIFSHNTLATDLELLSLEPLEVVEGDSVLITPNNLHMILDYPKYGIRSNAINFRIAEAPAHGSVTIDIWPHEKNSFSLEDIARDKVHYIHDGSENHLDHIVLEAEFSAAESYILPAYLQGKFKFTLAANIIPLNDPPVLDIPSTAVLRLAQGSKITLDGSTIKAKDPDSSAKQLVFNILEVGSGHFEYTDKNDVPISSFTQEDIENGRVLFVHHRTAANESHISLQVSDGIETSEPTKVRVSAFPQYWRLQNNTGLLLKHFSAAILTPFNLSFISNVQSASENAQFQIVQSPQFGLIEVERELGVWKTAVIFTSMEVKQHQVRYRHTTSQPDFDEFQFRSSLNTSTIYTFRMTFAKCRLMQMKSMALDLNSDIEGTITSLNVEYQTEPIKTESVSIIYTLDRVPKYGYLFSSVSKYRMRPKDSFSQEDVVSGNLKYRLFKKSYSSVLDHVYFSISAPGCKNLTGNLTIVHQPKMDTSDGRFILKRLQVEEGGQIQITQSYLYVKSEGDLIFNVTEQPLHGFLQIVRDNHLQNNTDWFTLGELRSNQLYYSHDGSETREDSFTFLAISDEDDFQYVDTFNFVILLKNDNEPKRIVDRVFHVVVGGKRLLTSNDLKYIDDDLDTKPSDILYAFREISNGEIYSLRNNTSKINQFTQEDLDNGIILFKHSGPEYGKIKLWISDGHFHVTGILEVQASAPFIRVFTHKKVIVQHGKSAVITKENIHYDTNLYASSKDVIYEVITKPTFGKIVHTENQKVLTEFTQADVNDGKISYHNEQNVADADEIGLRVRCRDAVTVAQLGVWMLPASFWEPLLVKNCRSLTVEESTSVLINKDVLQVVQPDVPASAIIYHVHAMPENGYLSILTSMQNPEGQSLNVQSFTQALINENRVVYIQAGANETKDHIAFNVTNGMVWLHALVLEILIIPEHIYLVTNALSVNEGGTAVLSSAHLIILTDYYKNRVTHYEILDTPDYGCIQIHKKCIKLQSFSQKDLFSNVVQYAHDGSENLYDKITLVAVAGQKRSVPIVVEIRVLPVNDQRPKLVNNTGLIIWEGGRATITNSMLAAIDADRPKDTLQFQVLGCWWGNVSVTSDPSASVQYFTQELIDKNMIVFQHQNGTEAKFNFHVSDGLHSTKQHTFYVKTKPVSLRIFSRPLHIFPLQKKYLTYSHLLVVVSDPERLITYDVIRPPSLGRLMMESETSGVFRVVSTFTQNDLNNSKVFYEHTHPFANLYVNDSFDFNVDAHLAEPLLNQTFHVDISVSSGGLDAYINVPKINVDEGGMTKVLLNLSDIVSFLESHAGLRSPIIHASASPPKHGQVFIEQSSNLTTFTQAQLESGQVRYQHDHSDTLGDNIYFTLYLIPRYILLCNITVPITINPINDQVFKLVTKNPYIVVVQGENHTITRDELLTEDEDTVPADLHYDVIVEPSRGNRLVLMPEDVATIAFTQADIDNNRIIYVHNSSALADKFNFRVSDQKFQPDYAVFMIRVLPLFINASIGLPLYIQQGSSYVLVTDKQFFIDTNADKMKIQYSIQTDPKHGIIYIKDGASKTFTQNDLYEDNVRYMQTDMTATNDSFSVFVGITSANTIMGNEIKVHIRVQPLMQIGNFTAVVGDSNKISLKVLDATSLARLSNSNPRYTITLHPRYGQIRKVIRSSGERKHALNTPVSTFTHEEVQNGLIFLVIRDIKLPYEGYQDQIGFVLAANSFQPAASVLRVNLRSSLDNSIHPTLAASDPAGRESDINSSNASITKDYFLIVSIVAGVVVLGIIIIVIIKCRSFEPDDLKKEEQHLQPLPLPRPPDRLLVSRSPIKQDGYVSPIPTALPHCKVTPLNKNELDTHARYPYGADEHPDDWSSCDNSDLTCPNRNNVMLRRNQYWV